LAVVAEVEMDIRGFQLMHGGIRQGSLEVRRGFAPLADFDFRPDGLEGSVGGILL
jgi:hypothetical protein